MRYRDNDTSKNPHENKPILQFKGLNGHVYLFENHIVIERHLMHKLQRYNFSGKDSFSLSAISEIHLKRASDLKKGYIRFIENGKDASYLSIFSIDMDNGTISITKNNNDFVIRFINRILEIKPSILFLDLDTSTNKDVIDKITDVAASGKVFAAESIKKVDGEKIAKTICDVGVEMGTELLKKKLRQK